MDHIVGHIFVRECPKLNWAYEKNTHANTEILTVTWNQPILVKIPCSRILYVSPTKQARLRIFKSAAGNMDDIKSI